MAQHITIETVLKRLDQMETDIKNSKEAERKMMKKCDDMELEMLKCQDELVALKRTKVETNRQLEENMAEIHELKSVSQSEKEALGLTRNKFNSGMEKLDQLEKKVEKFLRVYNRGLVSFHTTKDLGEEVSKIKTETSIMKTKMKHQEQQHQQLQKQHQQLQQSQQQPPQQSVSSPTVAPPLPVKKAFTRVMTLQQNVSSLTTGSVAPPIPVKKALTPVITPQQNVSSPTTGSVAPPIPVKKALTPVMTPQQNVSSPTTGSVAAPLQVKKALTPVMTPQQNVSSPNKGAVAAPLPAKKAPTRVLTPKQLLQLKEDSAFSVWDPSRPDSLRTGLPITISGYGTVHRGHQYIDTLKGVYKTPVQGKYEFGGWIRQIGRGKLCWFVCSDKDGRRELVGTTDNDKDGCGSLVSWECEEGESVWREVVRKEGKAVVGNCEFYGKLL